MTISSPEKEREEEEFDLLGKGTFSFSIKENLVVNTLGHVGTSIHSALTTNPKTTNLQ